MNILHSSSMAHATPANAGGVRRLRPRRPIASTNAAASLDVGPPGPHKHDLAATAMGAGTHGWSGRFGEPAEQTMRPPIPRRPQFDTHTRSGAAIPAPSAMMDSGGRRGRHVRMSMTEKLEQDNRRLEERLRQLREALSTEKQKRLYDHC